MEIEEANYYKHYITVREDGAITDAWSDGPHPEKDTSDAVCINEHGDYQFSFYAGGEINPAINTFDRIPLYKWDGSEAVPRADEEIEAERATAPPPPPTPQEQLRADVDFLLAIGGLL